MFRVLSEAELVIYFSVHRLETMDRVLYVNLVRIIILQHVVQEVVRLLETEQVIVKWYQIHVYLRNFVLENELFLEK